MQLFAQPYKASRHYSCFVLYANALEMVSQALAAHRKVLLGFEPNGELFDVVKEQAETVRISPYRVVRNELRFSDSCIIPHDVVSMYAITNALMAGAKRFELVGFDGYEASTDARCLRLQTEMNNFFHLLEEKLPEVSVSSILPSSYDVAQSSIYYHLIHGTQRV